MTGGNERETGRMPQRFGIALIVALALPLVAGASFAQTPAAKITVTNEAQLPRFSYPVAMAPSALLVADDATFNAFAAPVGADIDKTLATYDIADPSSKRDLLSAKLAAARIAVARRRYYHRLALCADDGLDAAYDDRLCRDGAYFRANHVRVVNTSWGDNVSEFEEWIARTDKTSGPQARKAEAQALYAARHALRELRR